MGTFSSNTTMKVSNSISMSGYQSNGSTTLYTAPSNGYAILNVYAVKTGSGNITIGGQSIFSWSSNAQHSTMYVGPGQSVNIIGVILSGDITASISGVEFINTP